MPAPDCLLDAYRIIRRVDSPGETPWPGLLAHSETTGTVLLVEAESLGEDWPGWEADAESHLLGPLDVVRRPAGHLVALPPFAEPLEDFLRRREDAPLTDGERLTIIVSLLRGLVAAAEASSPDPCGRWWLTDGGKPVFAMHGAGPRLAEATEGLLQAVVDAAGRSLRTVLEEALEVSRDGARLSRNLPRLEEALFAVTTPEALATTVFPPRRARAAITADPTADVVPEARESLAGRVVRHVDADLADTVSQITTAVWRRFRSDRPAARKRPLLFAGAAAAAVLAAGLLWPAGGPATAQPEQAGAPSPAAESPAAPTARPSADVPETEVEGLAGMLNALLAARSACAGDESCLAAVVEAPKKSAPAGAIDLAPDQRTITLLDDFGGAAVLRVDALDESTGAQLIVIVRRDEKWLIRDVHDVADQPL
ncbi:hypothetical protein ABZ477_02185 [Microbacterium sp. NPDC019599]|uniref:hypothetical protein n=1 Tax=Microbacterium sp. NPDC019599 TaxID=3154690 RepID=UPI0033E8FA6D